MFDSYKPLIKLSHRSFSFSANRFELWEKGIMTDSGSCLVELMGRVTSDQTSTRAIVEYSGSFHQKILSPSIEFDLFMSNHDRLQLLTIPEKTNSFCIGLDTLQNIIGATRTEKFFLSNEPYCCNLFTISNVIAKLTFSFSNPERLLEFYSTLHDSMAYFAKNDEDQEYQAGHEYDYILGYALDKLKSEVSTLDLNSRFSCSAYNEDGKYLVRNEKGHLKIEDDQILVNSYDGSGDHIIFYERDEQIYCKYVIMNGQIAVDQPCSMIDLIKKGLPAQRLTLEI